MRQEGIIDFDNEVISLINAINYIERAINPEFLKEMHLMVN
jgi:hypothetical protein